MPAMARPMRSSGPLDWRSRITRAVILDPTFFSEKVSIGPLFHLLTHARDGKANEIFGAFGLAFEDYAIGILRRMYPDRAGLASRLRCPVVGCDRDGRDF